MKKQLIPILLFILIFLFLLNLSGCGNTGISDTSEGGKVLFQAIDRLSKANSYELTKSTVESTTFGDKKLVSQQISEQKVIFEPFATWNRSDSTSTRIFEGGQYRTLREVYQVLNDDQIDLFMRYSPDQDATIGNEPVLGEWQKITISPKEQTDLVIDMVRNNFDAQIYLLNSNIDTFKIDENDEGKDESILKYDGYLEQATILEVYQKYIRKIYVEGKMLTDSENLSLEDLKNEIIGGDLLEIKVGIPMLAYSEKPVPISLWIDKTTFELKKVSVDKTLVLQSYAEKEISKDNPDLEEPIVSKALLTYEIKSIDNFSEIPMPD